MSDDILGTRAGSKKAQNAGWRRGFPLTPAFNPTSLVNGFSGGFWRADVGVSQTGGTVTAWADQSTNNNNFGVGSTAPKWTSTSFNTSFPGVDFSQNTNAKCTSALTFASTTLSLWMLMQEPTTPSGSRIAGLNVSSNDAATPGGVLYQAAANGFSFFSGSNLGNGGSAVTDPGGNTPYLAGFIADGAHGNLYLNGAVQGAGSVFSSTLGSGTNPFDVGNNEANTGCVQFITAYVLLTSKALSAGDITSLKTWTNSNWGTSF